MFIDKKSPIPAYYQLKNLLLDKIRAGEYKAGDCVPSERELSDSLNISRMTARQAINLLAQEGYLVREKGKGTFVNHSKFQQKNIDSFSKTVHTSGKTPSTIVLGFDKDTQCFDIKKLLDVSLDETIVRIKRLRLADNEPIAIEELYIPERLCAGIEELDLTHSFYEIIKDKYSIIIDHVDYTIEAKNANKEIQHLLDIAPGIPVLKISGITYSPAGSKLFYQRDLYRSDKYNYHVTIYATDK